MRIFDSIIIGVLLGIPVLLAISFSFGVFGSLIGFYVALPFILCVFYWWRIKLYPTTRFALPKYILVWCPLSIVICLILGTIIVGALANNLHHGGQFAVFIVSVPVGIIIGATIGYVRFKHNPNKEDYSKAPSFSLIEWLKRSPIPPSGTGFENGNLQSSKHQK
ncbi:MAG: hypothetical protein HY550_01695 [Elusimicrobia bacterium]|nr:hypothetical protein [Elusimicrobiota bacterium]